MAALEDIQPGVVLSGIIPGENVTVVAVQRAGESSIRLWGSTYYVIKVTLALVIGMFRSSVAIPEEGDRG